MNELPPLTQGNPQITNGPGSFFYSSSYGNHLALLIATAINHKDDWICHKQLRASQEAMEISGILIDEHYASSMIEPDIRLIRTRNQ
jgi:hypothetical protein